jgi:hypothetical protein
MQKKETAQRVLQAEQEQALLSFGMQEMFQKGIPNVL